MLWCEDRSSCPLVAHLPFRISTRLVSCSRSSLAVPFHLGHFILRTPQLSLLRISPSQTHSTLTVFFYYYYFFLSSIIEIYLSFHSTIFTFLTQKIYLQFFCLVYDVVGKKENACIIHKIYS